MAYLNRRVKIPARLILVVTGAIFIAMSAMCWFDVQNAGDDSDWVALALMAGLGSFLYGIAWSIAPTNRVVPDESGVKSNSDWR